MRIADADGLIKHFENVVDVKFFTPANVITIIKTFSGEVEEGHAYTFRSEDGKLIVTDLTEKKKLNEIFGGTELSGWIPVTTSDPTPEQIEKIAEEFPQVREYPQDFWQYTCPLPEDEQEVLITDKWGDVALVTFYVDDNCLYFEGFEDRGDVVAWMPLPKPHSIGGAEP